MAEILNEIITGIYLLLFNFRLYRYIYYLHYKVPNHVFHILEWFGEDFLYFLANFSVNFLVNCLVKNNSLEIFLHPLLENILANYSMNYSMNLLVICRTEEQNFVSVWNKQFEDILSCLRLAIFGIPDLMC